VLTYEQGNTKTPVDDLPYRGLGVQGFFLSLPLGRMTA